jgi:hypothetical protein
MRLRQGSDCAFSKTEHRIPDAAPQAPEVTTRRETLTFPLPQRALPRKTVPFSQGFVFGRKGRRALEQVTTW